MKCWQPISTAPLDTPVIVTDGRSRRIATLKSQKPTWQFEAENQPMQGFSTLGGLQQGSACQFTPTHWFSLPKLPVPS